jgi:hypothetical protein
MPLFSRRPAPEPTPRRAHGIQRWLIPGLGAVTPVGLMVVNVAIFIARHLPEFRWTITILAFVSGMMLNGWMAVKIYRLAQRRWRENALVSEVNQDMVLIGGMLVVIVVSFLTALFCYLGLANENNLPNAMTFLTGLFAILVPFVFQAVFQRLLGRPPRNDTAARPVNPFPGRPLPPPPPAPFPVERGGTVNRRG